MRTQTQVEQTKLNDNDNIDQRRRLKAGRFDIGTKKSDDLGFESHKSTIE